MKVIRLLIVCCCVVLVFPTPVQAARYENVGCSIAELPFLGWLSGLEIERRTVVIDGVELNLSICALSGDSYTAEQMLVLLADTLPYLSAHAGVPLLGSKDRRMVMVDKEKLMPFADGQLTEGENVIEIHPRSQDWTVVHEGAHYWANSANFHEPWMIEGYAEYLTERVMIDRNSPQRAEWPSPACARTPLQIWHNTGLNFCGYTAGALVWRSLSEAVGEELFMKTLHKLATSGGVDSERLLMALEQASGKDLLDTMRPVFPAAAFQARKLTRQLTQALIQAEARGKALGIVPPGIITQAISAGNFAYAQQWMTAFDRLFPASEALVKLCSVLDLHCAPIWQALPSDPNGMPALQDTVQRAGILLDQFASLWQRGRASGLSVPLTLVQEVQEFAPAAAQDIGMASASLAAGRKLEDRCVALGATCADAWQRLWSAGAYINTGRVITATATLLTSAEHIEQRCDGFTDTCRGFWHSALKQGQLAQATQTLHVLGQALDGLDNLQQRCGNVGEICRKTWADALASGRFAGANQTQQMIVAMLASAQTLQTRCTTDWPCQLSWQATYRQTGDVAAAIKRIDDIGRQLPMLQAAARVIAASAGDNAARDRNTPIIQAQQALAEGRLDQAAALAEGIIMAQQRREQIARIMPIARGIGLLAGLAILLIVIARAVQQRQRTALPAAAKDTSADLLAALLAQPPRAGKNKSPALAASKAAKNTKE